MLVIFRLCRSDAMGEPLSESDTSDSLAMRGSGSLRAWRAVSSPVGLSGSGSSMDELPHGDAFFLKSFEIWTRRAPVRSGGAAHG